MKKLILLILLLSLSNSPIQASYPFALDPATKAPLTTRVKLKMTNTGLKIAQFLKCNPYYIFNDDNCDNSRITFHLMLGAFTGHLTMKKFSNKKISILGFLLGTFGSVLTLKVAKKISNFLGKHLPQKILSTIKPNDIKFISETTIAQYTKNYNSFLKKIIKDHPYVKKIINNKIVVYFLGKTKEKTQSEQHLKSHYNLLDKSMEKDLLNNNTVRCMINKIHTKEQEEQDKGRYTFVHAQQWHWHFTADLFKKLWELQYNEIINDYQFLRFEAKNSKNKKNEIKKRTNAINDNDRYTIYMQKRADRLFMNHAIFGNLGNSGSFSMRYFLENFDRSNINYSVEELFETLDLKKFYQKYETQFEQLRKLHEESSQYGNMLLLSFSENQLKNSVIPTDFDGDRIDETVNNTQTYNTKTILDALRNDPEQIKNCDEIIYCAILTQDLVLDPKNGPRIFSFNVTDEKKFKAYEQLRDEIFAKLAQDIELAQKSTNIVLAS